MFQLILPFQLDLPFDRPEPSSGTGEAATARTELAGKRRKRRSSARVADSEEERLAV